ncbi:peptide chain release factor N(5)-glutamine methyltransferase [uncultured Clostridium sp.]|uniref:peptide chain release factor N(5)-glutamine methyltransferase n=1 Tax=uncultured Clostridium sp. TaxID=59620 RepID=UPI002636BF8C|nr:peptide chain release factor N(5)-glutamine methyltransferase [uncultured Clostridium sp.]
MKKSEVGGQAVLEGVMMRGSKGIATAVRTDKGKIKTDMQGIIPITKRHSIFNIPFIRGVFVLLDSMYQGIKALNYSASFFEDTEPSKLEDFIRDKFGEKSNDIIMIFTIIVSLFFSGVIFLAIPTAIASIFKSFGLGDITLNIIEAFLRVGILVGYMYVIGRLDDINRLFQYHGAEHKTIFCYEAGEKLTVENVKKYSRFHPRCGTNFLFLVMIVSIALFTFTGWGGFLERLFLRVLLIPIVSGISYEIIRWLGKNNGKLAQIVSAPGIKLQNLTTREPDDEQIEVAIVSLKTAEGIPEDKKMILDLINLGMKKLDEVGIETARLDATLLLGKVIGKDRLYMLTNADEEVSLDKEKVYFSLIQERMKRKPMHYILEKVEFMGLELNVREGVLIPRDDTEVLVERVLKEIRVEDNIDICDLCSGSGAIGIALAYFRKNINVDAIDLYPIPEAVTKENIKKLNLEARITFIKSDLLNEVIRNEKKYDIIVSNPPYIKEKIIDTLMDDVKKFEPHTALSGGDDGLVFYRRIIDESISVIKENGILAFEIGHDQGEEVKELMENRGYKNVEVIKDLATLDRVVIGRYLIEK